MTDVIDHARFVSMLAERFPAIAADIDTCCRGLLHLEMGTFAIATQAAISAEDVATVREHFKFIDDVYRHATPEVKNAVHVSHLEHISFDGQDGERIGAWEMLSPQLSTALRALEGYWAKLFEEK